MLLAIISLILLILISGFFSIAETSLMATNRYRLKHAAKSGNAHAKQILQALRRPDRLLGVILIGNTCANIFASTLATLITIELYGQRSAFLGSIFLTVLILMFAEIIPKTIAAIHPERTALFIIAPLRGLLRITYPLVWLVNAFSNGILRLLAVHVADAHAQPLSHEELRTMVHESSDDIPSQDRSMLLGVFDLKKITVDDIMVSRSDILGINLEENIETIMQQLHHFPHTRAPVFQGTLDNALGILHVRDILACINLPKFTKELIKKRVRRAYFIPESVDLKKQLFRFQKDKNRLALIVDEYGTVKGLVTLDDILEEIVGVYTTDVATATPDIIAQKDGSYLMDGSLSLRELNKTLGTHFSSQQAKTINGFIFEHLEAIPKPGLVLDLPGCALEILFVQHNFVQTVRLRFT